MHSDVRPYLMDLGSANGTYLNNERIETERYYELLEKVTFRDHNIVTYSEPEHIATSRFRCACCEKLCSRMRTCEVRRTHVHRPFSD